MPVRAVTTRFMYKGLCTIPDVLSLRSPVILPEDELEGESRGFMLLLSGCCDVERVVKRPDQDLRAPAGVRASSRRTPSCTCIKL